MQQQFRRTRAEISRSHLIDNLNALRNLQKEKEFLCPMVKCNAYGHGAFSVSRWLVEEGVEALGVALVEEALELRDQGISQPEILVFGVFPPEAVPAFVDQRLTAVISNLEDLVSMGTQLKSDQSLAVHLKVDTGMRRLGLDFEELSAVKNQLKKFPSLKVQGLCTHLACADDMGQTDAMSDQQLIKLNEMEKVLGLSKPVQKHVLNSTGLVSRKFSPQADKGWENLGCRPGISLYGCFDDHASLNEQGRSWVFSNLKPVMTLVAELVKIKELNIGESVSYGATWKADKPSRVGVLAVGYGDGYPRLFSNLGKALYRGRLVPVIGRVCMDYTLLDLSDFELDSAPKPGDEVILFGDEQRALQAEKIAQEIGTISYEIFTGISSRVPRVEV